MVGLDGQEELRGRGEGLTEALALPGAGAAQGKGADLPQRAVAHGVAPGLQDQVGDVLQDVVAVAMVARAVVPLLKAQLEAGVADVLQAHHAGVGAVVGGGAGDDDRVEVARGGVDEGPGHG